jgi:glycosyltransferase involved in cell wall biosynthesis
VKHSKVLLVDFGVMYGGGQVYLTRLIQLLEGQAEFFVLCSNPELSRSLADQRVHVFQFAPANHWSKLWKMSLGMAILVRLRIFRGINVVWINGTPEIIFSPLARILGCKTIATRHLSMDAQSLELHRTTNRVFSESLFRKLASSLHKVVCVSEAVATDLANVLSLKNLVSIPNWVSVLPDPITANNQEGSIRLVFVGRLQKYKGAHIIIDAMKQLTAQNPELRSSLTIVGDGECCDELALQAQGLNVRFTGFQKITTSFYRNADLFINPSMGPEGLPLVSLEAMSFGLPCILSDLRVHREISENGRCALLFRSGDAADLCLKIQSLVAFPTKMRTYGQLGRTAIESKYSADAARINYLEMLQPNGGISS